MIDAKDAHDIINTSLYFGEMLKKISFTNKVDGIKTKTQLNLMLALQFNGSMNMSELSEIVNIAPEQTTRSIRSLREAGLVECTRNPENQRKVIARLTDKGRKIMDDGQKKLNERLDGYLSKLNPKDVKNLANLSRKISGIFERAGYRFCEDN